MAPASALLLAATATAFTAAMAAAPAVCPTGKVNCEICRAEGISNAVNYVSSIPRLNRDFSTVPSDWSEYETLFRCEPTALSANRTCNLEAAASLASLDLSANVDSLTANGKMIAEGKYRSTARNALNYVEATLSTTLVIPVLILVLLILFAVLHNITRLCCCWCCCKRNPVSFSKRSRRCARACMCLFFFGVIAAAALGWFLSLSRFSVSAGNIVRAPTAAANLTRSLRNPVASALARTVGGALVPTLLRANVTLIDHAAVPAVVRNVRCVNDAVRDLPSTDELLPYVDAVDNAVAAMPPYAATRSSLAALNDTVSLAVSAGTSLPQPLAQLDAWAAAISAAAASHAPAIAALNTTTLALESDASNAVFSLIESAEGGIAAVASLTSSQRLQQYASINTTACATCSPCAATGCVAARQSLLSHLDFLVGNLSSLQDLRLVNATMVGAVSTIASRAPALATQSASYAAAATALGSAPQLQSMRAQIAAVDSALAAFNAVSLNATLSSMRTAVDTFPNITQVNAALRRLMRARDMLPCIVDALDRVRHVNATLLRLPEAISNITDNLSDVNGSIGDAMAVLDDLEAQLDDVSGTFDSLPDLSAAQASVASADASVSSMRSSANLTALAEAIEALAAVAASAQRAASASSAAQQLHAVALAAPQSGPSGETSANLTLMEADADTAHWQAVVALDAMRAWSSGRCASNSSTQCSCDDMAVCMGGGVAGGVGVSQDCGGGLCNMTLAASQRGYCADQLPEVVECDDDGDCMSGTCAMAPETQALLSALDALHARASAYSPQSALLQLLRNVRQRVAEVGDSASMSAALVGAQSVAASMPNATDAGQQLSSVAGSMGAVPDPSRMLSDWDSLNATLDSLPDLSGVRSDMRSLNDSVKAVDTEQLDDLLVDADRVLAFMTHGGGLARLATRLSEETLRAEFESDGLSGLLRHISDALDEAMAEAAPRASRLNVTGKVGDDNMRTVEMMDEADALLHGPAHFFARLLGVDVVDAANATGGEVDRDASGNAWPNGSMCVTLDCVDRTIASFSERPMKERISGLPVDVPLAPQWALLAPYLLPLLVPLYGLLIMCCCFKCPRLSRFCMFLQIQLVFLLTLLLVLPVGLFEYPLMVFVGDACNSLENTLHKGVRSNWRGICEGSLNGTFSGTEDCAVALIDNETVTLRANGLLSDLLGQCDYGARTNTPPPYPDLVAQVRAIAQRYPSRYAREWLDEMRGKELEPLGRLRDDLLQAASNLSSAAAGTVQDIGATFSCENVNRVYYDMKDAFCCDVYGPLHWFVVSWYAVLLFAVTCGCCSSLCGYSRFSYDRMPKVVPEVKVDPVGETHPIVAAARTGDLKAIDEFMRRAGDLSAVNAVNPGSNDTALIVACERGDRRTAMYLLQRYNADPSFFNSDGCTALLYACIHGMENVVRAIFENKDVPVDYDPAPAFNPATGSVTPLTPLLAAAFNGEAYIVQLLIGRGADVNKTGGGDAAVEPGTSPLIAAAMLGHVNVVKALLGAKADPDYATPNGTTAMHVASARGQIKVVAMLMQRGANVNVRDCEGNTPLALSEKGRHTALAKLLRSGGAKNSRQVAPDPTKLMDDEAYADTVAAAGPEEEVTPSSAAAAARGGMEGEYYDKSR